MNITTTTTAADLIAAGFAEGDYIIGDTPSGGRVDGTIEGMRVRGYQERPFAKGIGDHATELIVRQPGGKRVRWQVRKLAAIRKA